MRALDISNDRSVALRCLASDVFSNLVTLKMLTLYPDSCSTLLLLRGRKWACLTELDVSASPWDRKAYPHHRYVVFVDGNSRSLVSHALAHSHTEGVVYKVHDLYADRLVGELSGVRLVQTFLTYSRTRPESLPSSAVPGVDESTALTPEAIDWFSRNGYTPDELGGFMSQGASWFSLRVGNQIASLCMAFRNYDDIWEIGGVFTQPDHRRKGYAKRVVQQAVRALESRGLVPRYQFRSDNSASQALAESVGLRRFLTVNHFASDDEVSGSTT